MEEAFTVKALKCGHCGSELPIMGQFVTFQCNTCFRYWILSPGGMRTLTVLRASPPPRFEGEPVLLPFWVFGIDSRALLEHMEAIIGRLRSDASIIAGTTPEMEGSEFESMLLKDTALDPAAARERFIRDAASTRKVPASGEIRGMINRIGGSGQFFIYVPAFASPNTYAYLKIGRLLTGAQPSFGIERSEGLGHTVLCALQADEAASLLDYVFIATLPQSVQCNGDFLEDLHVEPSGPGRLIEFPFERSGESLNSLIGNFTISNRLIEGYGTGENGLRHP